MKNKLLLYVVAMVAYLYTNLTLAQAPNLGSCTNYAIFTADGSFTNTGLTQITGNVGTQVGVFSGFPPGIVTGQVQVGNAASAQVALDVQTAYSSLTSVTCGATISANLGSPQPNPQVLTANVYCLGAAATLKIKSALGLP